MGAEPVNMDDLYTALDRIVQAEDMIRTALTTDDRINSLVLKAQRILYETANRIQNLIDAQENNT